MSCMLHNPPWLANMQTCMFTEKLIPASCSIQIPAPCLPCLKKSTFQIKKLNLHEYHYSFDKWLILLGLISFYLGASYHTLWYVLCWKWWAIANSGLSVNLLIINHSNWMKLGRSAALRIITPYGTINSPAHGLKDEW